MKTYLIAALLGLGVGCTKQTVTTSTADGDLETNTVLVPKRGLSRMQQSTNAQGHTTGIINDPAQVDAQGVPARGQVGNAPNVPNDADSQMAQRVRVAISTGSTGTTGLIAESDLTPIQVEANAGVVTLRGTVETEQEAQSVVKTAGGLIGVKEVRNELKIGPVQETPGRTHTVQGNANETLPGQK